MLLTYEVDGNRAPEYEGAPEGGVLGEYEEVGLAAEVLLPRHLDVHVLGLGEEVGHLGALVVPLGGEVGLPLGVGGEVLADLGDREHDLLQGPVVSHNLHQSWVVHNDNLQKCVIKKAVLLCYSIVMVEDSRSKYPIVTVNNCYVPIKAQVCQP